MSYEITDEQIAEIEALAKKAPSGPWGVEDDDDSAAGALLVSTSTERYSGDYIVRTYSERFAFYVESLYPEAVLALISRLRAAERDVERLDKLDAIGYAYGFEDMHEGNRWMIDGPYRDIRAAIDDISDTAMKGEQQ